MSLRNYYGLIYCVDFQEESRVLKCTRVVVVHWPILWEKPRFGGILRLQGIFAPVCESAFKSLEGKHAKASNVKIL